LSNQKQTSCDRRRGQRALLGLANAERYPNRTSVLCFSQHEGRNIWPVLRARSIDRRLHLLWRLRLLTLHAQGHIAGRYPARGCIGASHDSVDHHASLRNAQPVLGSDIVGDGT
jgi:hypothetical protein